MVCFGIIPTMNEPMRVTRQTAARLIISLQTISPTLRLNQAL